MKYEMRVAAFEAERAIRNLVARYMKLCDQPCRNTGYSTLGELFCKNAIWEGVGEHYSRSLGKQRGRAAITEFLNSYLPPESSHFKMNVHLLGSDCVTIDGWSGQGQWVMLQNSTYDDDTSEIISARLTIDFQYEDGMWRIAHFRTERLFCAPWQATYEATQHWGPLQRPKLRRSNNE